MYFVVVSYMNTGVDSTMLGFGIWRTGLKVDRLFPETHSVARVIVALGTLRKSDLSDERESYTKREQSDSRKVRAAATIIS